MELGRARGLDAPHRGVASGHGQTAHHAGDQTAAAHRDHHGLHVGKIFGDLQAHRGLPGHDVGVVEGRDHREPFGGRERFGFLVAVGGGAAREHDLAAPFLDPSDFHRRRRLRHHDDSAHAELLSRERDRLAVVAAGVGDDASPTTGFGQPANGIIGAAQLEGADRLEVLEFQPGAERVHALEGRADGDAAQRHRGFPDGLGGDHATSCRRPSLPPLPPLPSLVSLPPLVSSAFRPRRRSLPRRLP